MRALLLLAAVAAQAATIRGVVLEDQSGKPLVRTIVAVTPLSGTVGGERAVVTGLNGEFAMPGMAAGTYLVSASRRGFAPVQYGQKRWGASGIPLHVDETDEAVIEIRMSRYGAVSGRVLDENNVGIPGHAVAVYRDARPLLLTAQGVTDDRGVFRVFGLEPGPYLVRSLTHVYEDASYVPTFFKDVLNANQARAVEVELGADSALTEIHATPGTLFTLSGSVTALATSGLPNIQVTIASETGSTTVTTDERGQFEFAQLPPGRYELSASGRSPRGGGPLAAFRAITLDRNYTDQRLMLEALPQLTVSVEATAPGPIARPEVLVRRSSVSGPGKVVPLKLTTDAIPFDPGYWEFAMLPNATSYAAIFTTPDGERITTHADGWNRVLIAPASLPLVKFAVANTPASVQGTVKGASGNGVADVPVFLEPTDLEPARRLSEFRWTRSDASGRFSFLGLPPGIYRLLGTFEFLNPRAGDFDRAQAQAIQLSTGQAASQDLDLYVIRQ